MVRFPAERVTGGDEGEWFCTCNTRAGEFQLFGNKFRSAAEQRDSHDKIK